MNKSDMMKFLDNLDDKGKKKLFEGVIEKIAGSDGDVTIMSLEDKVLRLRDCFDRYTVEETFKVGDIVKWKDGLQNRTKPDYEEPCIVIEILHEPIINDESISSPYHKERLDIKLGLIKDNKFFTFYFESGRFTLFT